MHLLAVQLQLHRHFFFHSICGHNSHSGIFAAKTVELFCSLGHALFNGLDGENLSNHAGRSYNDIRRVQPQGLSGNLAHPPGFFLAVGIAGVGVAAVAHHGLSDAVLQIALCHQDRRALNFIEGIDPSGRTGLFTENQGQIRLGFIAPDAAVDTGRGETLCGGNAAFDKCICHYHEPPNIPGKTGLKITMGGILTPTGNAENRRVFGFLPLGARVAFCSSCRCVERNGFWLPSHRKNTAFLPSRRLWRLLGLGGNFIF